jgi:hypothetical protein
MSHRIVWIGLVAGFAVSAAAVVGLAQTSDVPAKWFGASAPKAKGSPAVDPRRLTEIAVELAWLADPTTFPYFLEAKVDGSHLTVHGFVPDKTVRDQALRLARLYSAYAVTDGLKEHASLRVRPTQTSPAQLHTAAQSALREALTKQKASQLQVQCAADGTVTLRGPVASVEDKLAASLALRRLYGCTHVQNQTQAPAAAEVALKPRIEPANPSKEPRPGFGVPTPSITNVAKADKPPALVKGEVSGLEGPKLFPGKDPEPKKNNPPPVIIPEKPPVAAPDKGPAKLPLSPAMLMTFEKVIRAACPELKDVKIETAMNKLRIELTVRQEDQISPCADKVFNVPELADFRETMELAFTVAPKD